MVTLAFNELRQSVSLNFLWIFWFWDKYNEIFKKVEISLFQPQWPKLFEKGRGLFVRSTIVDLGFLMQHVTRKIPKIIYFINLHSSSFNIDMEITHNHEVFADQASFTFTQAEIWNSLVNRFVPNAPLLPLKTSENLTVFWCFRGVEKGCIWNKCVKIFYKTIDLSCKIESLHWS